jgi:hypothetical protein
VYNEKRVAVEVISYFQTVVTNLSCSFIRAKKEKRKLNTVPGTHSGPSLQQASLAAWATST